MSTTNPIKWKHYEPEIILLNVRWYLKYSLSYRNLEEMMKERGLDVVHTTIMRWVHEYAPALDRRIRPHLKPTNDSWKVDETYIKVKGKWKYLYRSVDSEGNTLDFMLSAKRDKKAAKRFFRKVLKGKHNQNPRVINVDKNAAYPPAIGELKSGEKLPDKTKLRRIKYLNNLVEQDHRFIKKITNPGLGFYSFNTARQTIRGIEAMHMIRKGQIRGVDSSVQNQVKFINQIFGIAS